MFLVEKPTLSKNLFEKDTVMIRNKIEGDDARTLANMENFVKYLV